jgi:hypothetical protein
MIGRFTRQSADREPSFGERFERERMDVAGWLGAGGGGLPAARSQLIPKSLGHLGAAGIACTKNQDRLHDRFSITSNCFPYPTDSLWILGGQGSVNESSNLL